MSVLNFIADIHVANHKKFAQPYKPGVNSRAKAVLGTLSGALGSLECSVDDVMVVLGDLLDTPRTTPRLMSDTMGVLAASPLHQLILPGNHETIADGAHGLGPLHFLSDVRVIDTPALVRATDGLCRLVLAPYLSGDAEVYLERVMHDIHQSGLAGAYSVNGRPFDVLCAHVGIYDDDTPWFLKESHGAVSVGFLDGLAERYGLDLIIAGDWHKARVWERPNHTIVQAGSLCPTGFRDEGLEGYGRVWSYGGPDDLTYRTIPGPRFVNIADVSEVGDMLSNTDEHGIEQLFCRWKVPVAELEAAQQAASACVTRQKILKEGDIFIDVVPVIDGDATVKAAVAMANAAGDIDNVLAEYVRSLQLPTTVSYSEVLGAVKRYLGGIL